MFKKNWGEIKQQYRDTLLLGNGASIAIDKIFMYHSLFEVAKNSGYIPSQELKMFEMFGTQDFELVLKKISDSQSVMRCLEMVDGKDYLQRSKQKIKDTLIKTIKKIHPQKTKIDQEKLQKVSIFVSHFNEILSLNYDLLLMWSTWGKYNCPNRFNDCFIHGKFDKAAWSNESYSKEKYVFYPHGNLLFGRKNGEEIKIWKKNMARYGRLNMIANAWKSDDVQPLFVSECSSKEKLKSIKESDYLTFVYDKVLTRKRNSLVIYGMSFSENDSHIIKQVLTQNKPSRVCISIFDQNKSEDEVKVEESRIRIILNQIGYKDEIDFISSCDHDLWIYYEPTRDDFYDI